MTRHALPRKRVAATLCGFVFVEWLLFELLRAPYRPPQDMTTFLGAEKFGVMAIMAVLADTSTTDVVVELRIGGCTIVMVRTVLNKRCGLHAGLWQNSK